jgi:hypothetical protein
MSDGIIAFGSNCSAVGAVVLFVPGKAARTLRPSVTDAGGAAQPHSGTAAQRINQRTAPAASRCSKCRASASAVRGQRAQPVTASF